MWVLPKVLDYGKFYKWLEELVWIINANKWGYGSILGVFVERMIVKYVQMIMWRFWVIWICKVMRRNKLYCMILTNDFRWGFIWKEMRKQKQCDCKLAENKGHFANKLVMIGPAKNYNFWWVD